MSGPLEGRVSSPKSVGGIIVFALGAIGLMGAMFTDVIAVIGRQLGVPFLGSVEIAQICVVLIGGASLVAATATREHANVRVFTERLPASVRGVLERAAQLASAAFFALLLAGSAWISWELRDGAERTELLAFPVVVLRVFWLVCAAICLGLFLRTAFSIRKTP